MEPAVNLTILVLRMVDSAVLIVIVWLLLPGNIVTSAEHLRTRR